MNTNTRAQISTEMNSILAVDDVMTELKRGKQTAKALIHLDEINGQRFEIQIYATMKEEDFLGGE
jgi:hypothetical protein